MTTHEYPFITGPDVNSQRVLNHQSRREARLSNCHSEEVIPVHSPSRPAWARGTHGERGLRNDEVLGSAMSLTHNLRSH